MERKEEGGGERKKEILVGVKNDQSREKGKEGERGRWDFLATLKFRERETRVFEKKTPKEKIKRVEKKLDSSTFHYTDEGDTFCRTTLKIY